MRRQFARLGGQAGLAELVERWPAAVGAAIARNAWPSRLARDGTVLVNTADSVWAFELTQRAQEIAGRLGVETVRFAPGPLATADPPPPAPPPVPSLEQRRRAAEIASEIADRALRERVEEAVGLSLAAGRAGRSV